MGVRDFLPPAAARRRGIAEALLAEFERWGYERIITPAFEYLDVLARGLGEGARAAALRFVEPATGEVLALRPDITPQVARIAATRFGDARGPVRLAYEGSVLRLAPGARGQRELIQAGVELIDGPAPGGDAEMLALAGAALAAAEVSDVTLDVGHVALARGALAGADAALAAELEGLLARKDADGIARAAHKKLPRKATTLLAALPLLYGEAPAVLARARELPLDRAMRAALDELEEAVARAREQGYEGRLTVDLGEVRGFAYYTGIRFAGYVAGVGDAVLRGGRYDDLVGKYGRAAQATGFAVDVEAIAQAEHAHGGEPAPLPRGVLVGCRGEAACRRRAYGVAAALRRRGIRAAIDLGAHEGDAALWAYAVEIGARVALVCEGQGKGGRALDAAGGRRVTPPAWRAATEGDARALAAELSVDTKGERDGGRRHRRRAVG